ncbi:helix-turn-helix domain-containing protein [Indioceanicola profundi]|uniref:helix-turn-helix domain-containing protein n=1 Tax=Indioceanicola profundi TaxID=2220096 RepID=UPI000E6AD5A0|nr:short-chain fatty acyl-CoA regulator family protein [Indioceanicola profundi]
MSEKKAMLGHKVRRLRRELKLTQAQMAEELSISPSYLNLIEANQRPLTVPLLLKIGQLYDIDLSSFAEDDEHRVVAGLKEVFADPLFEMSDIKGQDMKELAAVAPTLGQAVVTLYRAYLEARQDLGALAERLADGDKMQIMNATAFPQEEVGEFFQEQSNHFPEVETAAETLWIDGDLDQSDLYGTLSAFLEKHHGTRVKLMPVEVMGSTVRRYDRHSKRVLISEMLPPAGRSFQLSAQIALLRHRELLTAIVEGAGFSNEGVKRMALAGLSNYFAGCVMMPYGRFLEAAKKARYDIEILQNRFVASFEQVAHRLTTLQRPGAKGVPFFFFRIDNAGNVSKRFSAAPGFHFARFGGACPRWNVHDAFRMPGAIQTQLAQMPDGTVYFSLARRVIKPGGGWKNPPRQFAIALGTDIVHAGQLVYADGVDIHNMAAATPIGVNCRICPRLDCTHRAFPPLNHRLDVDENIRGVSSYVGAGIG